MRTDACSPWATAADVLSQPGCGDVDPAVAADAAATASNLLYLLSAQQFTGSCGPVTVRPVWRPVDQDTRGIARLTPAGYVGTWGYYSAWGVPVIAGVFSHFGGVDPPEIELGASPIIAVEEVKIDGVVVPPDEYYVRANRILVRQRLSASATPTQRWGWPLAQIWDLPDTEPGTFSVTFTYGTPPPPSGVLAAKVLGAQIALAQAGKANRLPQRITSLSRQGVSMAVVDVQDFLHAGMTGLYEVDVFLKAVNPFGYVRKPVVWSPDIDRPIRTPSV